MICIYMDESGTEEKEWFVIAMVMTRKQNPDDLLSPGLDPLKKRNWQGFMEFHAADANWEERKTCLGLLSTIDARVGYVVCEIPEGSQRLTYAHHERYLVLAADVISDVVLFHPNETVQLIVDDKFWSKVPVYGTENTLSREQFHDRQIEKFEDRVKSEVSRKLEAVGRGDLEHRVNSHLLFCFDSSHKWNGIQLADCVAYTLAWSHSHIHSEEAVDAFDRFIKPRLVVEQEQTL